MSCTAVLPSGQQSIYGLKSPGYGPRPVSPKLQRLGPPASPHNPPPLTQHTITVAAPKKAAIPSPVKQAPPTVHPAPVALPKAPPVVVNHPAPLPVKQQPSPTVIPQQSVQQTTSSSSTQDPKVIQEGIAKLTAAMIEDVPPKIGEIFAQHVIVLYRATLEEAKKWVVKRSNTLMKAKTAEEFMEAMDGRNDKIKVPPLNKILTAEQIDKIYDRGRDGRTGLLAIDGKICICDVDYEAVQKEIDPDLEANLAQLNPNERKVYDILLKLLVDSILKGNKWRVFDLCFLERLPRERLGESKFLGGCVYGAMISIYKNAPHWLLPENLRYWQ